MRTIPAAIVCVIIGCQSMARAAAEGHALPWAQRVYNAVPRVPPRDPRDPREGYSEAYDAAVQVIGRYGPSFDRYMLLGHCEMRLGDYCKG